MKASKAPIEVKLQGGLGNQLFGVAFAEQLKFNTGRSVILDARHYSTYDLHALHVVELCRLLSVPLLMPHDYVVTGFIAKSANLLRKRLTLRGCERESVEPLVARHYGGHCPARFEGYYQTFENVPDDGSKFMAVLRNQVKAVQPSGSAPCVIHVRRGDFHLASNIGILEKSYYENAIAHLKDAKSITVISDERPDVLTREMKSWSTNGVELEISEESSNWGPWEVLASLARASQLICSNSTLCWWAARLGEKQVISPSKWVKTGYRPNLNLKHWKVIDVAES